MPTSLFLHRGAVDDATGAPETMLHRIRQFDWSTSPAGPVETWAPDIRSICRTMLRSSTPMAVLIGRTGAFVYNDAARALIGDAYDALFGKAVLNVFAGTDDFYGPVLEKIFAGHSSAYRDFPFQLLRDGSYETVWFDLDYTPIVDDNGVIHGALLIGNETTGRVRTLQDLQLSREKLDHALDASGIIGTWSYDFATRTVYADERFARLHGLDPEETRQGVTHSVWLNHILPEDLALAAAAFETAVENGYYRSQHRIISDAGLRWVVGSGRISYGSDGAPVSLSGVVVDVTRQIETADALTASELRFRTYTETLPHIVFSCNTEGRTTYLNRRWYEFTGQAEPGAEAGDAAPADWLTCVHPDDQQALLIAWREALANGAPCRCAARNRHKSGEYRWSRAVVLPVRNQNHIITSWIGTWTDIHESRMLEAELEAISHELEHRIRNLFALVQGLINITAREDHTLETYIGQLRSRLTALHRAHGLIKPGPQGGDERAGSLLGLIAELLEPYDVGKNRAVISGADMTINARAMTWLALIFHELATNAAKYGAFRAGGGVVQVTSEHVTSGEIGPHLRIIWKETGAAFGAGGESHSGFGSRLLTMIVESNLRGSVQRDIESDGMRVTLKLPVAAFG